MHELRSDDEPSLSEVITRLSPADVVIVEGYKREAHPKIECRRADARRHDRLSDIDPTIVAVACETPSGAAAPREFDLDDVPAIADFVERHLGLTRTRAGHEDHVDAPAS